MLPFSKLAILRTYDDISWVFVLGGFDTSKTINPGSPRQKLSSHSGVIFLVGNHEQTKSTKVLTNHRNHLDKSSLFYHWYDTIWCNLIVLYHMSTYVRHGYHGFRIHRMHPIYPNMASLSRAQGCSNHPLHRWPFSSAEILSFIPTT